VGDQQYALVGSPHDAIDAFADDPQRVDVEPAVGLVEHGEGINRIMRRADKGVLLITHYERLLEHVRPDKVHVLQAGRVTRSGDIELARELEREGYAEAAA
jgi:Fe-S cluster assembly ATPase SufC